MWHNLAAMYVVQVDEASKPVSRLCPILPAYVKARQPAVDSQPRIPFGKTACEQ